MSQNKLVVQFKKLHDDAIVPQRGTPTSAGFDLYALEDRTIFHDYGMCLVPTGIAVKLPPGTYGRIAMRSGHAVKHHLAVGAGVIDIDYAGPIGVAVHRVRPDEALGPYSIKKGERFAQLIIEKISYAESVEVTDDFGTAHLGFGSTGNF